MAAKVSKTRQDDPESLRLYALRLTEDRKVTNINKAASFVAEVGVSRLLTNGSDGFPSLFAAVCGRPCPAIPKHSHKDEEMSLAWQLKDSLIEMGVVYYSKLIAGQPTFAAIELIPSLVGLYAKSAKLVSEQAQIIYKALSKRSPQTTRQLKESSGLCSRQLFDDAISELQTAMLVVPYEVQYEPSFTYIWGLAVERFPQIKEKTKSDPTKELFRYHLRAVRTADNKELVKRFRLPLDKVNKTLLSLESGGELTIENDRSILRATANPITLPVHNVKVKTGWD
ncbi:MAG TPA: hypothetical protein VFC63_05275 [Blastocatellia bacterium]|nr:hypothetical protein [Blastocatellia bacterium]